MATIYTYSIASDTAEGRVSPDQLQVEVSDALPNATVAHISTSADVISVAFEAALSANDQATLDNIVATHVPSSYEFSLGNRLHYQFLSAVIPNEIQYTAIEVPPGVYDRVRVFLHLGGDSGATLRAGVYSNRGNAPHARLAYGERTLTIADNDTAVDIPLSDPLNGADLPDGGPVWLALLGTTNHPQLISTDNLNGEFHPVRFEQTVNGQLPATVIPVKETATAVFVALVG